MDYSLPNDTSPFSILFNQTTQYPESSSKIELDWPLSVRYGVPLLCVLIFTALLFLLYKFPSPKDETENFIQRRLKRSPVRKFFCFQSFCLFTCLKLRSHLHVWALPGNFSHAIFSYQLDLSINMIFKVLKSG